MIRNIVRKRKMLRSCRTKKKYNSKKDAQKRADRLYKKDIMLSPYTCHICNGWHLRKIHWSKSLEKAFDKIKKEK